MFRIAQTGLRNHFFTAQSFFSLTDFVICKIGTNRYRCQFFYSANEQFGTGRDIYDDLAECVTTLLQVQADHEKTRQGVPSGASRVDLGGDADDAYDGPLLI